MTHKDEDREDEEEEEEEGGIVVTVVVVIMVESEPVVAAVVDGLRDKIAYDRNRQLHHSQVVSCWPIRS